MEVFVSNQLHLSTVAAPPSKSYAQRLILAAALSNTPCHIRNIGASNDVAAMLNAVDSLGAASYRENDNLVVLGNELPLDEQLHCGESGLGARLISCVAPLFFDRCEIHGEGSLLKRPMTDLEQLLPQFGVRCQSTNNGLPMILTGRLKGAQVKINASSSSQYLSGLLMALPLCKEDSLLEITALASKPYIDMTLAVLREFGIKIQNEDYRRFLIPGNQTYRPQQKVFTVEGDYSGAAAWMVLSAISQKEIAIAGLLKDSAQADRALTGILAGMGTRIEWRSGTLFINEARLAPFEFDATDCPDLFPVLVTLAAACNGLSTITGTDRLRHKESDRATVLRNEFGKLGLPIEIENNRMLIHGTGRLDSGTVDSNNDHRIAMAAAIAAVLTDEGITIQNAEAVAKSYPEFWEIITPFSL